MRVAITGATGFVGRHLVAEHLRRGDLVRILTRQRNTDAFHGVETCVGDLADAGLSIAFPGEVDVLYHCAAELRNPARMRAVNLDGTRGLAMAAAGRVGRWVQLSSVGVYGPLAEGDVTEDSPLQPTNEYEISKAAGDKVVLNVALSGGFELSILRPSNIFGRDMPNRSLFHLATVIRRGLFFYVGPPGASANYIHIDNVIDALLLCGTHPAAAGRTYNLSDWISMEDFVGTIAAILQVPAPRLRLPRWPVHALAAAAGLLPGSPLTLARIEAISGRSRYPTRRIEMELGYRHRTSIVNGLHAMLGKEAQ